MNDRNQKYDYQDIQARNGIITLEDLKTYAVRVRVPLVGSYRGHAVVSSPPPSSGGQILLTLLNIMETLPKETPWRSAEALHLYIEGSKRAFADRAFLGDPLFVPLPFLIDPTWISNVLIIFVIALDLSGCLGAMIIFKFLSFKKNFFKESV